MTDEIRDHAEAWRLKPPARVRDACTPEAILLAVHGVEAGAWACPSCSRVYQLDDYPKASCPSCWRYLPTRCTHVDPETERRCDGFAEPRRWEFEGTPGWLEPGPHCEACNKKRHNARRADVIRSVFPAKERRALAAGYTRYPHRADLDRTLDDWIRSNCGRDGGRPWIVAHGEPGTGKTLALLYHAAAAYHGRGLVKSIGYVTEEAFIQAASLFWSDTKDEREKARDLIQRCASAELLVFDEAGASQRLTDYQHQRYTSLLKYRIDGEMPTLLAMNRGLDADRRALAWLDIRVDSRLDELAVVVACTGVDLRRGQG